MSMTLPKLQSLTSLPKSGGWKAGEWSTVSCRPSHLKGNGGSIGTVYRSVHSTRRYDRDAAGHTGREHHTRRYHGGRGSAHPDSGAVSSTVYLPQGGLAAGIFHGTRSRATGCGAD